MTGAEAFTHFLCLSVDVQGYSGHNDIRQREIQQELVAVLDEAASGADVARAGWLRQPQGDGELSLIPQSLRASRVVGEFCLHLAAVLRRHNGGGSPQNRLRLRLAMDFGLAAKAANGYAGRPPIRVSRLVDSRRLRDALTFAEDFDLAVLLADVVYQGWVVGGHTCTSPDWFRPVHVEEKQFRTDAWLWVPIVDGTPADKTAGWEFLLLADTMRLGMDHLAAEHRDDTPGLPGEARGHLADRDIANFLTRCLDDLAAIAARVATVCAPKSITSAVGRPGEPGDATRITSLARRFVESYEEFLDWAAHITGITVDPQWRPLLDKLASLADKPVHGLQRLVDDLLCAAEEIANHYRSGRDGTLTRTVSLTIELDAELLTFVCAERNRLAAALRSS